MGITALQLQAKVTADTSDASKNLKQVKKDADDAAGSGGSGGGIKGLISTIAGMAIGGGIVAGVSAGVGLLVGVVKDSVAAAQDAQITQANLANAIKDTNNASGQTLPGLEAWADHMSLVTTFTKDAIEQVQQIAVRAKIPPDLFTPTTQDALDMAQAMGISAPEAANVLTNALDNPKNAVSLLRREHVNLTDAEQKEIAAAVKAGDTHKAQALILDAVTQSYHGAAQAAGSTLGGQLQILQNALHNTEETIGNAIIPILAGFLQALQPLEDAIGKVLPVALQAVSGFISSTFAPIWKNLQPTIKQVETALSSLFGSSGKGMATMGPMGKVFQQIADVAKQLSPIIADLAQKYLGYLVAQFKTIAGFVVSDVLPMLGQLAAFFVANVMPVVKTASGVIGDLATVFINDVLPALQKVAAALLTNLVPPLEHIMSKILPVLNVLLQFLGWLFQNVIGPVIANVIGPALVFLITVLGKVLDVVGWVIDRISDFIGWLSHAGDAVHTMGTAFGVLGNLIGSIWADTQRGFKLGINTVIGDINSFINFIDKIQIHIPSVGIGPVQTPAVNWNGLGIPDIPLLAAGGDVNIGGNAVVGDRGPELLSVGTSGARVTPLPAGLSGAAGGGAGGQPIVLNATITLDGIKLGQAAVKYIPQAARHGTGIRSM